MPQDAYGVAPRGEHRRLGAALRSPAMNQPILQFGTSRFLQAHVDLFVSQALPRGEALGGIAVVQTTASAQSAERVQALSGGAPYPVHVRGLRAGVRINDTVWCNAVQTAWQARSDWPRVRSAALAAQVIVSNTGDQGYQVDARDGADALAPDAAPPHSFPAKLLVLLHGRWQQDPHAALTLLPCELIARNGDTLRDLVITLGRACSLPPAFADWLHAHCVWGNSLVDRIVSEALHPIGAVAEPYALWAVEKQPRLVMPCAHPAIVLTDDLAFYEQLKLYLLNLGHSLLAERWLHGKRAPDETVLQAMNDTALCAELEATWADEVLPVFDALGRGAAARDYLVALRERLRNPFLVHRLADIAQNHAQKKQRRFAPVVVLAESLALSIPQTRLRAALGGLPP